MPVLLFTCPNTHRQAPSGIETDVESLRVAWTETVKVHCPHCGEEHHMSVRDTYLEGVLYEASSRLAPA
jgi:predicted RNA-binding Zn-ribbon protein involved in translation (DUF1610 family)